MFECLILGDSIAKGVSMVRQECAAYTQVGVNSEKFTNVYLKNNTVHPAKTVIISLGANDPGTLYTEYYLTTLRSAVNAERVFWIVPNNHDCCARKDVLLIAKRFGDFVIDTRNHPLSPDKVHPTGNGYIEIAKETK